MRASGHKDTKRASISSWAFTYRRLVLAVVGALMIYGFVSYFTLSAREDPEITIRQAVIYTSHPGLPPDKVELLITKTLEEAIIEMPEIEELRSSSLPGLSIIHVEILDRYTQLEQIWDDLRQQINTVEQELPDGTQPPQVNDRFGDVSIITMALTGADYTMGEMFDTAQHVRDILYGVKGTEKIDILGVQEERIFLEFSAGRLAELGISPNELSRILQQQNIIQPGGIIDTGRRGILIEPSGNFENIEDIRNTLVPLPQQNVTLPLRDIVNVEHGTIDPPERAAYFNGQPALIFGITMRDHANILDFSPRIKEKITEIEKSLPAGYKLNIATYQAEQVENAVQGVTLNVLETLAIVLGVVILFLGVRTGLIVGTIVPAVMLGTLAIMNFTGIDLERMSLATLIISLGLLVDNGIVVAEDFIHRREDGATREDAVRETGRELAVPLFTSSFTTVLMFMPLMLAQHAAGEYTRSVSLVILITLAFSWFIALMVTPTLCYYFARVDNDNADRGHEKGKSPRREQARFSHRLFRFMNRRYEWILIRILKHRILFLMAVAGILIGTIFMGQLVESQFFPSSDRKQILIYVDLPADASATATDQTVRGISDMIMNGKSYKDSVGNVAGYVGFGGPRFVLALTPVDPASNKGFMVININESEQIPGTVKQLRRDLAKNFPNVNTKVTRMFLGPTDSSVIEIQVKGPDAEYIYQTAQKIESILHDVGNIIDIENDWEGRIMHLKVDIDQRRAKRAGITSADIARALQRYYSGDAISRFRQGDDVFPIVLRADNADRHNPESIGALNVYSEMTGDTVPLYQVADVRMVNDFARRERENLMRTITVEGRHLNLTAEQLKPLINDKIEKLRADLPLNHTIEYDGVIQDSQDAQQALRQFLPLCLGLIFIAMIWQFNSFRRTAIIFITLPLLIIGAVLGLLVFNAPFGFMVTLGLYALAGILVNNSIVLIDRIDIERNEGDSDNAWEAVISASVRRLRPIIMSSTTTVLGLLPLILTHDVLFYGMAAAIAMGLAVGTILTLGVVPTLYTFFYGIKPRKQNGDTA